jgi:hypothetical protein
MSERFAVLDEALVHLLQDKDALKIIGSVGKDGIPDLSIAQLLDIDADSNIRYFELLEHSRTNQNLTYSLWFNRSIAILAAGADGRHLEVIGTPVRAIITGEDFEKAYIKAQNQYGNGTTLSTLWLIRPESVHDKRYAVQKAEEQKNNPFLSFLDQHIKENI